MDRPMVDLLLYLAIIGGAVAISGVLLYGIVRLSGKISALESIRRRREAFAAVRLYRMMERQVPGDLNREEYERAVRYVIQKYPISSHCTRMDPRYISVLITEAIGQDRLSRGTLAIAAADRETEDQIEEGVKMA